MILAIHQAVLEVHGREASQHAGIGLHLDALFDGRDIFLRHRATHNAIVEFNPFVPFLWFEDDLHFSVLARTARLLLVGIGFGMRLGDGFTISHLRRADIRIHTIFALQAVNDDFQMQFAHAGQNGLAGFLIGTQAERWVFPGQFLQAKGHFLDPFLGLRLDRNVDDRHREGHAFQNHRIFLRGQRVTRAGILQADECRDITREDFLDFFTLIGVHLEHTADTFLMALGGVQHLVTRTQHAAIDAHKGQIAVFVVDDLERQACEGLVFIGGDHAAIGGFILAFFRRNLDAFAVNRRRQVFNDGIQQGLHALVLEGCAAQYRAEFAADGAALDAALQGFDTDIALIEIFFHRRFINADNSIQQLLAIFGGLVSQIGGDRRFVILRAKLIAFPDQRLHLNQINNALEGIFNADRQLQRNPIDAELFRQRFGGAIEIGAGTIELVDEDDARNIVTVSQAPIGLRLRLHAGDTFNDEDRAIKHAQGPVHFNVEVDMARRVDDVDAVVIPHGGHGGGGDGNPALTFLVHVIGGGIAFMHLTDLVGLAGVVQDAFCRGGLARVNMRGDADIADTIKRGTRHGGPP